MPPGNWLAPTFCGVLGRESAAEAVRSGAAGAREPQKVPAHDPPDWSSSPFCKRCRRLVPLCWLIPSSVRLAGGSPPGSSATSSRRRWSFFLARSLRAADDGGPPHYRESWASPGPLRRMDPMVAIKWGLKGKHCSLGSFAPGLSSATASTATTSPAALATPS